MCRPLHDLLSLACRFHFRSPFNLRKHNEAIHRSLRLPWMLNPVSGSKRSFHVGQAVLIGRRSALRVCLSSSQIVDVAERMAGGQELEAAVAPLLKDIDGLFVMWADVTEDLSHRS